MLLIYGIENRRVWPGCTFTFLFLIKEYRLQIKHHHDETHCYSEMSMRAGMRGR